MTRIHKDSAWPTGVLIAPQHPDVWLARRQRPQARDRLGAVTREDGGELSVPGSVLVQRVCHVGGSGAAAPGPDIQSANA